MWHAPACILHESTFFSSEQSKTSDKHIYSYKKAELPYFYFHKNEFKDKIKILTFSTLNVHLSDIKFQVIVPN